MHNFDEELIVMLPFGVQKVEVDVKGNLG